MDAAATQALVTDPVCGMQVDTHTAAHTVTHGGRVYHFCSAESWKQFQTDRARYKGKWSTSAAVGMALSSLSLMVNSVLLKRQKFCPA